MNEIQTIVKTMSSREIAEQVLVIPKGLTKLAQIVGGVA